MTPTPAEPRGLLGVVGHAGHPADAERCPRDGRHDLGPASAALTGKLPPASHTGEPPPTVPSWEPPATVLTGEPPATVLTGEPPATVLTGEPPPTVLSGELASAVMSALGAVRDPELDEPVTSLGFVTSVMVSADGDAEVRLRLPTYFCAPNFAFLMAADAYDAVRGIDGVRGVRVVLEDHFAAEAVNGGVAAQAGFAAAFDGEAAGELHQLRADFLRKAVMAGTDQLCRPLLAAGAEPAALTAMTLGDLPPSPALDRLRQRRAELGLPAGDDAPLVIDPVTGAGVGMGALPLHLRRARVTRVSIQANASICRGMLRTRYQPPGPAEPPEPGERGEVGS
jgi:metal-sulfur cluster biosynthetic enzyme